MAEPVIVPIQLEVTDVDMSGINWNDAKKEITTAMSGIKKSIQDAFSGIDASAINKPIEAAMASVTKSVQAAEDAQLRYREALIRAGKSSKEYQSAIKSMDSAIKSKQEEVDTLSLLGPAAMPNLIEARKELEALIKSRDKIDPVHFIDSAESIQLEKVANAYKKVLAAIGVVDKKSEEFNQTVQDNRLTEEYNEYLKQAEAYKKKLEELDAKSKRMEALGATDKQWEALRYDTDQVSASLDGVIKKMREAVKTGEAFRFGEGNKGELSRQINSFAMSGGNRAGTIRSRAMSNESPFTAEYQAALDELAKLEKKVEAVREKSAKMIEMGASEQAFKNLVYDAESLDVKVDEVKNHLMNMVQEGGAFKFGTGDADAEIGRIRDKSASLQSTLTGVSMGAKKAQGGLTALGATHPKLAAILTVAGKIGVGFGKVASVAIKAGKGVAKGFAGVAKVMGRVGSAIKSAASRLMSFGKSGRSTSTDMNKRFKKLGRNIMMFGLGFRTAYYLIKRVRNIFIEGFKKMGANFDEVGKPMTEMMESFNRLKGSLATAFQPLVSVVMPIMTRFMNHLSAMLEGVGKFTAALTGQKYIYKAVAKDISSVSEAAKGANKQLGSYDKLEVIQQDNTGYDYEKDYKAAESTASKFAEMVKAAWEKADFTGVGQYLTVQLLNVLDNVEKNIIPRVTDLANRVLKSFNTFVDGFDTEAIGSKIGSLLNTLVSGLDFAELGKAFANINNLVWRFLSGLVTSIDWTTLGNSLATGLSSMFNTLDFDSLVGMVSGFIIGITEMLVQVIENVDWNTVFDTLVQALQNLFTRTGTALENSDNPLVSSIGGIFTALSEVIGTLAPIIRDVVSAFGPIIQSILPVISSVLPGIAQIFAQIVQMILPVFVKLITSLMPIISRLFEILLPLILDLLTALQPFFDAIVNVVLPVIVHLLEALMPLIEGILGLLVNILAPILSSLGPILEIIFTVLDVIITLLEPLFKIIGSICDLVGSILRPILDALTPILEMIGSLVSSQAGKFNILGEALNIVADIFVFITGILKGVVVPIINVLMGVFNALCSVLTTVGNAFKTVFDGAAAKVGEVWGKIKGWLNGILGGMESFINKLIAGFNKLVTAANKLSFDIPNWVPGLGGKKFGFNFKQISEVKIPRLAQGAVIPPNKEFLAMLGDQKSGTNIEAPLETIKQALAEVMAELGGAGNRQPIILQVNGRTLAQVVWDEQEKRYKQTGKYAPA